MAEQFSPSSPIVVLDPLSGHAAQVVLAEATDAVVSHTTTSHGIHGISLAQARIVERVVVPLNVLSIIGAILVVASILYLRWRHRRLADRVSLRLTLGIAIGDMFFSAFQVASALHKTGDNWWCALNAWGYVESTLFSVFLTVCIAFNLHAVFVHRAHPNPTWESWYFVAAVVGSFGASLPPWILGVFGYDSSERTCWYRGVGTRSILVWQWASLFGWLALAVLYCVVAVIAVAWKLVREQAIARAEEDEEEEAAEAERQRRYAGHGQHGSLLREHLSSIIIQDTYPTGLAGLDPSIQPPMSTTANGEFVMGGFGRVRESRGNQAGRLEFGGRSSLPVLTSQRAAISFEYRPSALADTLTAYADGQQRSARKRRQSLKMHQMIRRAAGRIILYPLVPILTQTLTIASEIDTYMSGQVRFSLYLASYAAASCPGLLNALAFIVFDPAVHNILRVVREDLLLQYRARRDSGQLGWSGHVALWALHGGQAGERAEEYARRRSARLSADFMSFGLYRDELEATVARSRRRYSTGVSISTVPRTSTSSIATTASAPVERCHGQSSRATSLSSAPRHPHYRHYRYRSFSESNPQTTTVESSSQSSSIHLARRFHFSYSIPTTLGNTQRATLTLPHNTGVEHRRSSSDVLLHVLPTLSEDVVYDGSVSSVPPTLPPPPSFPPLTPPQPTTDYHQQQSSPSDTTPPLDISTGNDGLFSKAVLASEAEVAVANEPADKAPEQTPAVPRPARSRHPSHSSLLCPPPQHWRDVEAAYSDIFAPLSQMPAPIQDIIRLPPLSIRRSASDSDLASMVTAECSFHSGVEEDGGGVERTRRASLHFTPQSSFYRDRDSSSIANQSLSDIYAQLASAAAAVTVSTPRQRRSGHSSACIIDRAGQHARVPHACLFSDLSDVLDSHVSGVGRVSQSSATDSQDEWSTVGSHLSSCESVSTDAAPDTGNWRSSLDRIAMRRLRAPVATVPHSRHSIARPSFSLVVDRLEEEVEEDDDEEGEAKGEEERKSCGGADGEQPMASARLSYDGVSTITADTGILAADNRLLRFL